MGRCVRTWTYEGTEPRIPDTRSVTLFYMWGAIFGT